MYEKNKNDSDDLTRKSEKIWFSETVVDHISLWQLQVNLGKSLFVGGLLTLLNPNVICGTIILLLFASNRTHTRKYKNIVREGNDCV